MKATDYPNIDISDKAKEELLMIFGHLGITYQAELKGYIYDHENGYGGYKIYMDSNDCRELSSALIELADWLDTQPKLR